MTLTYTTLIMKWWWWWWWWCHGSINLNTVRCHFVGTFYMPHKRVKFSGRWWKLESHTSCWSYLTPSAGSHTSSYSSPVALSPVHTSNNVEATLWKPQATLLPVVLPVASTLLLVWTGLYIHFQITMSAILLIKMFDCQIFLTVWMNITFKQKAQLPKRDRATRYVSWNLVSCWTAVRKITLEKAYNR